MSVTIIDYGMGNLGSIANMLRKIGAQATISSDPEEIAKAEKLILPGVGAFDQGMEKLEGLGFREVLDERVLDRRVPILGICLGMQLLTRSSDEGERQGLGWIDAETVRFRFDGEDKLRIPHMGWNLIDPRPGATWLEGLPEEPRFYFVHTFYVRCRNVEDVAATTHYGFPFTSAVRRDNIFGTQFHPEKSHKFGMALLRNFAGEA